MTEGKLDLEFEVVQTGIYGQTASGAALVQSAKDCTGFGIKKDVEAATNFETHVLAYISSGNKPTGGYSVVVKKVQYDTEKKALIIHAKDAEPKDAFVTMALTMPFSVVRIKRIDQPFDVVKARWMKKKNKEDKHTEEK